MVRKLITPFNAKKITALLTVVLVLQSAGLIHLPYLPSIHRTFAETATLYATSHITGSANNPNNALGAADGQWAGIINDNTSWTSRWAMDDPAGALTGTQTISVLASKGSNSNDPSMSINLYENGSLVQSVASTTTITSTTGQVVSGTFNASAISNPANVEIEVLTTSNSGSPSKRNSVQIDDIQWTVNIVDPNITAGASGTQASSLYFTSSGNFIGGAFTFVRDRGSANITQITISETGTIDANANLSNLKLFYKAEATCSATIPVDATAFNSTGGSFSSSQSTVTGSMPVGTSRVCVYAKVDVGAAAAGDTIEIQITNPSSQVTASAGTVSPGTAVAIAGTTTLQQPPGPTMDQVMRGGNWFSGGTEQSLFWAR